MTYGEDCGWGSAEDEARKVYDARKLGQLQDNLASFDLQLSPDQVKVLDDASAIELGFPQRLYAMELPRTFAYGGMRDQIIA